MIPASLVCALALQGTGAAPAATVASAPFRGAAWFNAGGAVLTAVGGGNTIVVPLGATVPLPGGLTLDFELTVFRWTCTGTASCTVREENGVFATAGFHLDTEGRGPLRGFFVLPKLQLSTLARSFPPADASLAGRSFGLELGVDLGYQWRAGPFYLALVLGASGGVATHHPSGLYGLLVEWNGSTSTSAQLTPWPFALVFGVNASILRLGFIF